MKLRLWPIGIILGLLILSVGCTKEEISNENAQETDNEMTQEETTVVQKKLGKSQGFEYDEERLTYELVWSDEFEEAGAPNPDWWKYDVGGHGWGNDESQFYTAGDNVKIEDGLLVIEARQEEKEGKSYTSTRLVSHGQGSFLYGRVEVRAKIPAGLGTWPAIWMLPTDWAYGNWPSSGEIDIMEHVGYDYGKIHGSIHTESYNHKIKTQKSGQVNLEAPDQNFHVYAIEWLPDKIKFFIDGEAYFVFEPSKSMTMPTYKEWPFDKRHHLLLNIAVGGHWGGLKGIDDTIWPVQMEVDYIRLYQSPEIKAAVEERDRIAK